MPKYEEIRVLNGGNLRSLCMSKKWYTKGTREQYKALIEKVYEIEDSGKSLTTSQLGEIAEDILEHSETNNTVENIMLELSRISSTSFYRIED
jgi:DNA-binding PadR family transcriptional regulator